MKRLLLLTTLILSSIGAFACPVCEKQQPAMLKGISHGTGPQSDWDMVIVWIMIVIVALTLFFSIKFLVHPGEKSQTHIKRFILDND